MTVPAVVKPKVDVVDWKSIEGMYRAGLLSVREISRSHGISHTAINKRAKAEGWKRDLAEKIRREVSTTLVSTGVSTGVSSQDMATERQIVGQGAETRSPPAGVKPLKPKQLRFIDGYMVTGNATQSYIDAGYSAKGADVSACKLLGNASVAAEVSKRTEAYTRTAGITAVALLEEAKAIAFSDIRQAFNADGSLKGPLELSDSAAAAIASIKVQELAGGAAIGGPGGAVVHVPMYTKEVKLWDKPSAIFKLLEYLKGGPAAPTTTTINIQVNAEQALVDLRAAVGR